MQTAGQKSQLGTGRAASLCPAGMHPAPLGHRDQAETASPAHRESLFIFNFTSFPCPHPRTAALGPGNHPPAFYFAACRWLRCDVGLEMDGAEIVWG